MVSHSIASSFSSVRRPRAFLSSSLLLGCLSLSACGGGDDRDWEYVVFSGRFIAPPVAGLHYQTVTQSGVTDASGLFKYRPGESITFKIGDIVLGTVPGAAKVNPFDLAGVTQPPLSIVDIRQALKKIKQEMADPTLLKPTSFGVAASIATFLQTVDEDGNPDNGISIPAALHDFATGKTDDIRSERLAPGSLGLFPDIQSACVSEPLGQWFGVSQEHLDPYYYSPLNRLLVEASNAGLWGGQPVWRNPALALDTLYAGLGLAPEIAAVTQLGSSYFDASVGIPNTSSSSHGYDAKGLPILINGKTSFAWYPGGRLSEVSSDSRCTYSYAPGRTVLKQDNIVRSIESYNAVTNTLERKVFNREGGIVQNISYAYDQKGNVIKAGGYTYQRDMNGYVNALEYDYNNDGMADQYVRYAYNLQGKLTLKEGDYNHDGIVDNIETYAYDSQGKIVHWMLDKGGDGLLDAEDRYTYHQQGANAITTIEHESTTGNGLVSLRETWEHDAQGVLRLQTFDEGSDGDIEQRIVHGEHGPLTSEGRLLTELAYQNQPDVKRTWKYDIHGNLTYWSDGTKFQNYTYTYLETKKWGSLFFF